MALCALIFVSILTTAAAAAQPPQLSQPEYFTGRRDFSGLLRQDMAERAARTAAELAAYEQAARILSREPDLQFLFSGEYSAYPTLSLSLDGLARMLFPVKIAALGAEGFPLHPRAVVRLELPRPPNLRAAIKQALAHPDRVELYGQVHAGQRILLGRYDALAQELLAAPSEEGARGRREVAFFVQSVVNEMLALELYASLLPSYDGLWLKPEQDGPVLRRAHSLAPKNPLILTALAELHLQTDQPVKAMERISESLRLAPDVARSHDVRGAVLLRQSLPELAAHSFGRAIALAPGNAAYRLHRAAAMLVLENEDAMCADLTAACALGSCDELQWARGEGRCRDIGRQEGAP